MTSTWTQANANAVSLKIAQWHREQAANDRARLGRYDEFLASGGQAIVGHRDGLRARIRRHDASAAFAAKQAEQL